MTKSKRLELTLDMAESYTKNGAWPLQKWDYSIGVVLLGLLRIDEKLGTDFWTSRVLDYCRKMVNAQGIIHSYNPYEYNIDKVNTGKVFFRLLETTGDSRWEKAIHNLYAQLETHPRTQDRIFWHKMIYPHQVWLDGLYMGLPFLAAWGRKFGRPADFDDIVTQITRAAAHLFDPKTGLYYHAWDQSNGMKWSQPLNFCSPHFWGRAMGWFMMAMVDVLDLFPREHHGVGQIGKILADAAGALVRVQDKRSGVWFQMLDQAGRQGNYLESSASSMIAYSLARGASAGYIPEGFRSAAQKAWDGIKAQFLRKDERGLHLTNCCKVAGLGGYPYRDGSYEYYLSEPIVEDDDKGVGAFILAGCELEE